jgi:hypothetical protein
MFRNAASLSRSDVDVGERKASPILGIGRSSSVRRGPSTVVSCTEITGIMGDSPKGLFPWRPGEINCRFAPRREAAAASGP